MVVCVCNAIKEKDLKAALIEEGPGRPADVYARMGRRPKCGHCLKFAQSIINSEAATA
ncbi:MAG: (2Fe-2S)-binding protein [Pseudomonadota bacterium]